MKKRLLSFFLLTLCLLSFLCSCGFSSEFVAEADTKVKLYLDYMVEHNRDAMYDLLYPGMIERENFDKVDEQMSEYCPITKDYQINRTSFEIYSAIGTQKKKTVQAFYDLSFEESEYVLITEYTETEEGCGFTVFRVITRAEYESERNTLIK